MNFGTFDLKAHRVIDLFNLFLKSNINPVIVLYNNKVYK
jgi:hypothetical protein